MVRETTFKIGMTISALGMVIMTFFYFQKQDELRRFKDGQDFFVDGDVLKQRLINERDSLQTELFVSDLQLGRYEVALEMLKEKNKTAAEEFELILTTQTE